MSTRKLFQAASICLSLTIFPNAVTEFGRSDQSFLLLQKYSVQLVGAELFFYVLEPDLFKVLNTTFAVEIYQYTA